VFATNLAVYIYKEITFLDTLFNPYNCAKVLNFKRLKHEPKKAPLETHHKA